MPTLATMEWESFFIWRMPKSATYIQPAGMPVTLHRPTDGNCAAMPGCVMAWVKRPRAFVETDLSCGFASGGWEKRQRMDYASLLPFPDAKSLCRPG
jgi:hypothetical protein